MTAHSDEIYTADTNYNLEDVRQAEIFNRKVYSCAADFERGELIGGYALSILELVSSTLGQNFWYFIEFPLQIACPKREGVYLNDKTLWQFWVNSRVDIIVMDASVGQNCRKARLILECQSPWHDMEGAQRRDIAKFNIIASTTTPLIYVRYADYPRVLRFWRQDNNDEVFYNPFTQEGKTDLKEFFTRHCL